MGNSSSQESDDGHQGVKNVKGKRRTKRNRDNVTQADLQKLLEQLSVKANKPDKKNVMVDREQWEQILKLKPQLEALAKEKSPGAHITQSQWDQFQSLRPQVSGFNQGLSHTTIRTDILQQNPPVAASPFCVPPPLLPQHPQFTMPPPFQQHQHFPHPNPQSTGAVPRTSRGGPANRGPKRGNKNNPDGHKQDKQDYVGQGQGQQKGESARGAGRGRGGGRGRGRGVPVSNDLVNINPGATSQRGRGKGHQPPTKKNNETADWVVVNKEGSASFKLGAQDFIASLGKSSNTNLVENTTEKVVIKKKQNKKLNSGKTKEEVTSDFVSMFIKNNIGDALNSEGGKQEHSPEFIQQMVASCTEYFENKMSKVLTEKPEETKPEEEEEPLPSKMDAKYVREHFLSSEIPDDEVRALLPSHWMLGNYPFLKQYITVELHPNSMDFVEISNLFHKTVKNELKIESIHRIENSLLWYMFIQRKNALTELFGGTRPEEKYLFHGTAAKNMNTVLENGFGWYDPSKPQPKKFNFRFSLTPFAKNAVQHCKVDQEGEPKRVFVAHVLQGTQDKPANTVEDLLTGDDDVINRRPPAAARIYRLLDEHASYPAFSITFTGEVLPVQREGK